MAASQTTIALRNSTDAEFRAIGAFIYAGLIAGGWTRVYNSFASGTGWVDVTAPAQNTYAVTEIWESPAETGLTKFYLKLRHGSSNSVTPAYAMEYQLGWGWTSGSSLSGVVGTARSSIANTVAGSSTTRLCSIAAGAGYAMINLGNGANASGLHVLAVERCRDSALAKKDELQSCFVYSSTGANLVFSIVAMDTVTEYNADTSFTTSVFQQTDALNSIQRGRVGLGWLNASDGGRTSPMETLPACYTADSSAQAAALVGQVGQTVQIPVYGVTRTYLIGVTSNTANNVHGVALYHPLFLYE